MGNREQEEPSTPILKTPAVEEQHKPEGMVGGGERSMIEEDEAAETGISCGTTTSEGHDTGHALRPAEGQGTSLHSNEPQRVTDEGGRDKPSGGKRGMKDGMMKDGMTRCQDRRREPSTIGMSGESCPRKRRRCVEDKGLRTGKRKRDIPESMQVQAGQEGASRDEAVTRAAKDPDTEVGMTVGSTAREYDKQGRNEERVMGSRTDRRTSAYSVENDDTREETTEGSHGAKGVAMPRCLGRGDG